MANASLYWQSPTSTAIRNIGSIASSAMNNFAAKRYQQRGLDVLPPFAGPKVIYAAACRLGSARLTREGITFKQTPYALEV